MLDLHPGVDADYMGTVALEADRLGRGDGASQVGTVHRGLGADHRSRLGLGDLAGEDAAPHRASVADMADQRSGIDAADPGNPAVREPVEPAALGGRDVLAVLGVTHDRAASVYPLGLHRRCGNAVVTDQRVGEGDDLPGVGGIGDRLLVTGHRGVEDDLAAHRPLVATRLAVEAGAVLEQNVGRGGTHALTPHDGLVTIGKPVGLRSGSISCCDAQREAPQSIGDLAAGDGHQHPPVSLLPAHQELSERLS